MTRPASDFIRSLRRPVGLLPLLLGAGVLLGMTAQPDSPADVRRERARHRLKDNLPAQERVAEAPRDLPPVDPELVDWYKATVTELADPAYEGRSPGSVGIAKAADLIENRFKELGLRPAFTTSELAHDGSEVLTPRSTFRQSFGVGDETRAATTEMTIDAEALTHGVDFSVLAYSGSGDVDAPVAFCGYAIVSGPDNFLGFDPDTRLDGKIALCLNLEPMDDHGNSRWQNDGFSHYASITYKAAALIRRGASAVLVVTPPDADYDRVDMLETIDSTRTGRPGLNSRALRYDAPVVHVTPEVARRILDRVGDPDLTLESLVAESNKGAVYRELGDRPIHVNVKMDTVERTAFNVGAVLPGRGRLADEYVVIGAHYDHVGYGGAYSLAPDKEGELHPGADDNASGTTGMMLAAQLVTERLHTLPPDQPHRSFLFLAFSAEEMGLLGSIEYTKEPIVPLNKHVLMLNMDMIGRLESDLLEIGGLDSAPGLEDMAEPFLEKSALPVSRDVSVGSGRSDHASFDGVGVPNMFFFTGLHAQYHRPTDTADLIDNEGAVRVVLLCTDIAMAAATRPEPLVHRRLANRGDQGPKPPKVRLGVLPANSTKGGVIVQRVFPDTSASDAGLRPDDRILTWDGEELKNTEDLRPRLSSHEPGDVVTLTVERDGKTIEVRMTLRGIE